MHLKRIISFCSYSVFLFKTNKQNGRFFFWIKKQDVKYESEKEREHVLCKSPCECLFNFPVQFSTYKPIHNEKKKITSMTEKVSERGYIVTAKMCGFVFFFFHNSLQLFCYCVWKSYFLGGWVLIWVESLLKFDIIGCLKQFGRSEMV